VTLVVIGSCYDECNNLNAEESKRDDILGLHLIFHSYKCFGEIRRLGSRRKGDKVEDLFVRHFAPDYHGFRSYFTSQTDHNRHTQLV